jgi:tetratricopeptide (TPR) repeat protein
LVAVGAASEPVPSALVREHNLFSRHRYDEALALLGGLLGRADLTRRQRFEALCRKAECLEHLRRPRQAVALLRGVSRAFPDEALGHSLLGEYLYRVCDDCHGAIRALNRALRINAHDPDSHWWKGQVYQLGLADVRRARRAYLAALAVDPKYEAGMESMASVCEAEAKWIEAVDWRKCHYRRTRAASDLVQLADLYLRLGNPPAAMKYARSAVRRSPESATAWLHYATSHAAGRRFRRAVEGLARFARLSDGLAGPFVHSRDFGYLESVLDLPGVRRLLSRLPVH